MMSLFVITGVMIMLFHSYLQSENRYKVVFVGDDRVEEGKQSGGQDPGLSFNQILEFGKEIKMEAFNIFLAMLIYCLIIPGLVLSTPVKKKF